MKRMKKFASVLLAVIMMFSLALPVMASGKLGLGSQTATLTIKNVSEGKEYDLYRVFDLTYADGEKYSYTVNSDFAAYFTTKNIKDPVKYLENLTENSDELSELAKDLLKYAIDNNKTPKTVTVDEDVTSITVDNMPYGYYLLNPLGGSTPTTDFATMFALNTLSGNEAEITVKAVYPTIDKTVSDTDSSDNEQNRDKLDETSIGKDVTFHLTTKVPDTTGYKKNYWFNINDYMSKGLTFGAVTKVTIGDKEYTDAELAGIITVASEKTGDTDSEGYTIQVKKPTPEGLVDFDGTHVKIVFKDFIKIVEGLAVGTDIEIEYTATLNEDAVINLPNTNEVTLTYSTDPKVEYDGDEPGPNNDKPTGITPISKTNTYTTAIEINKVDDNNSPLSGAAFKITGTALEQVVTTGDVYVKADDGTYWLLKDGTYTEESPEGKDPELYDSPDQKYKKETKTTLNVTGDKAVEAEAFVDVNGKLIFAGLGIGEYVISETVVPKGYNAIEDIPIKVEFLYDNQSLANATVDNDAAVPTIKITQGYFNGEKAVYTGERAEIYTVTPNGSDAQITVMPIQNKSGSILPSTGGIGTTIFYVAGGVLVLAAVVLLVTKKRMSAEK